MKRLSMRKLKEVLRLRYELGLGQRQIARSCSITRRVRFLSTCDAPGRRGLVGRCRKAGMIANWRLPYSGEVGGAPIRPTSRRPILPNSTKNSNAIPI